MADTPRIVSSASVLEVRVIRVALRCGACGAETTTAPMRARAWAAAHHLPTTIAALMSVNGSYPRWHKARR